MTYDTRKNMWLIFVALAFAALAAWLATRWMQTRIDLADNGKLRLSNMVIAARDVPLGKRIEAADVRLVRATPTSIPPDSFKKSEDVIGKVSRSSVLAGEALINRRLSKHVGGSSLAAVLEPGMRAVTVRVDDVIGVGGFVLPENRVDVLASFQESSIYRAETILHDIRVLAVDQRSDPGSNEPLVVRAVTLEVTPEGAEKIAAAQQRGRIQLTLLNPMSVKETTTSDKFGETEIIVRAPKLIEAGIFSIRTPRFEKPAQTSPPVTLIRGTQVITRKSE